MSLTPELVALCERNEPEFSSDRGARLSDQDYTDLALRLAGQSGDGPLWLFAYGSLIWKPVFDAVEERRATAFGWHRSFCLQLRSWRATPQQPGLMMALERGGRCDGVLYRLPDAGRASQIETLLRREVGALADVGSIRWLSVRTDKGPERALVFWAGPSGAEVSSGLPLQTAAGRIARACGHMGSCADYLYQTVLHLDRFGIRDRNLWRLQMLVANEIRTLHAAPP
jgi:cation transport protein ChaC